MYPCIQYGLNDFTMKTKDLTMNNWGFGHGSAQRHAEGQSYALWTTTTLPERWLNDFGQFSGSTTSSGAPNPTAYGVSSWSRMCQTQSWTIPNRGLSNWVSYFHLVWNCPGLVTRIVWYWVYHINKTNTTEPYKTTMLGERHLHFRWIFPDVFHVFFFRIFPLKLTRFFGHLEVS